MIYAIIVLSIAIDLFTKHLAVLKLKDASFSVIKDVLHFTYVENTGAAFGMFKDGNLLLLILSIIVLAAIIFALIKFKPTAKSVNIGAAMVIGGALGNIIDRIFRGFVVDFIDFRLINYPVFNIADCFIVCGAILFAVWVIFFENSNGQS